MTGGFTKIPRSVTTADVPSRSIALHRLALLTAMAMFPLIWFGGLTTSHQAGMSVPDWPNTYGYNMFAVPLSVWLSEHAGGIFYEHTHRLLGSLVGFLALSSTLFAWGVSARPRMQRRWIVSAILLTGLTLVSYVAMKLADPETARQLGHAVSGFGGLAAVCLVAIFARTREPRRWVRWLAAGLLLAVTFQGLLGGLRVVWVELDLAVIHGIFAQITLCVAGLLVIVTGQWWQEADKHFLPNPRPRVTRVALLATALIIGQLAVAALMRHYEAGLAVPDFPLHYGRMLPPMNSADLARANELRTFEYHLATVSLTQIWLHVAHRIGAVIVTLGLGWLVWEMFHVEHSRRPRRPAWLLVGLLLTQVCLGVATVWYAKPADIATAHVACGALLLLATWVSTLRVLRTEGLRRPVIIAGPDQRKAPASPTLKPASFAPTPGVVADV